MDGVSIGNYAVIVPGERAIRFQTLSHASGAHVRRFVIAPEVTVDVHPGCQWVVLVNL